MKLFVISVRGEEQMAYVWLEPESGNSFSFVL